MPAADRPPLNRNMATVAVVQAMYRESYWPALAQSLAAAQGGVTEGFYAMGLTDMPYRDTLSPAAQAWFDRYKDRYKIEPNIGAVYGQVAADLTVTALEKAGKDLTTDSFIKGMESIKGYKDIFNGPEVSFGPDKHQGANSSFLAVVKGGRWVRVTDPLSF